MATNLCPLCNPWIFSAVFTTSRRKRHPIGRLVGDPVGICPGAPGAESMTRTNPDRVAQPSLEDLMVRFLGSRSDAACGSAVEPAGGEVEPHEVAAGFRVDPRAAWTDATDALPARPESSKLPTEWASLVGQPAAAFAVAHAAGNFPQRVKDLQPLLA